MNLSKRDIANLSEAIASALIPVLEQAQKSVSTSCSNHMAPWTENELRSLKISFRNFIQHKASTHERTNLAIAHKLRSILSEPF